MQVAITGAAGQIGYALVFRVASGQLLGPDQPVVLRLLEIEPAMKAVDGVAMELSDCAFPLLAGLVTTSSPEVAFDGASWALLIGSVPRKAGMERADLLGVNGQIFAPQGSAIAARAASDIKVLVVGNPCNTNCLIARSAAPEVPLQRWYSMMRLDQDRTMSMLAAKAGVEVSEVSNVAVWGNHSATQYPDFSHALIGGKPAPEVITDPGWATEVMVPAIRQRGAAVIAARGASSAASAANAVIGSVVSIENATPPGDWFSVGVASQGDYGVPEGLQFGFPVRSSGSKPGSAGTTSVVQGLELGEEARRAIGANVEELVAEREAVSSLLRT